MALTMMDGKTLCLGQQYIFSGNMKYICWIHRSSWNYFIPGKIMRESRYASTVKADMNFGKFRFKRGRFWLHSLNFSHFLCSPDRHQCTQIRNCIYFSRVQMSTFSNTICNIRFNRLPIFEYGFIIRAIVVKIFRHINVQTVYIWRNFMVTRRFERQIDKPLPTSRNVEHTRRLLALKCI